MSVWRLMETKAGRDNISRPMKEARQIWILPGADRCRALPPSAKSCGENGKLEATRKRHA